MAMLGGAASPQGMCPGLLGVDKEGMVDACSSRSRRPMTYADVSRGIQCIFKERQDAMTLAGLEAAFLERFGASIQDCAGVTTREYLARKKNVFTFNELRDSVFLQASILAGPPIADPGLPKDEDFVLDEFEHLIEDLGPICYVSALCGKFIQRNGISVTSITSARPLDLLKRHPERFLIVGGGNVSLVKFRDEPEVQSAVLRGSGKVQRVSRALQEVQLPVPVITTEEEVVLEFQRLIEQDGGDSVYISSLCGRFLQRFRKPVTNIINSRPADFLRKYPEFFELVGGGNVRLRPGGRPDSHDVQTATLPLAVEPATGTDPTTSTSGGSGPSSLSGFQAPVPAIVSVPTTVRATSSTRAAAPPLAAPVATAGAAVPRVGQCPVDDADCADVLLHIAPLAYREALIARVRALGELIRDSSFLTIDEVVLGGAVGKGLAVRGPSEVAELVLLLDGMPDSGHDKWLPQLLETLLAVLEMELVGKARDFRTVGGPWAELVLLGDADGDETGTSITPDVLVLVVLAPSPGPGSPRETMLQRIRDAPINERQYMTPTLAREAVELITNQPEGIRNTMMLLRWWAAMQPWSCPRTTPPSYLLELLVLVATEQVVGLAALLEAALDLCARILDLKILWDGMGVALFQVVDICPDILAQMPLVVDPVNPCANVVDPAVFDGSELSAQAARVRQDRDAWARWRPILDAAAARGTV